MKELISSKASRSEAAPASRQARLDRNIRVPRVIVAINLLVLISGFWGFARAAAPNVGALPPMEFTPPKPERVVLNNGVIVYLLEDHELPLFDMNLRMHTSPTDEPKNLPGLLATMGDLWRNGGTITRSPEQLDDELEYMAASVSTGAGEESANVSLSCLSKDINKGLEIFQDVLFHPRFDEQQISLQKAKMTEALRRKNETLFGIGRRAFRDINYGRTHFYSINVTPQFIESFEKSDLQALYKKVTVPDRAIIAVSGDFKKDEIIAKLNEMFATWKPTSRVPSPYDYSVKDAPSGKIFYVEKDFNQSLVYVGGLGIKRMDPDQYELAVGNYILGDGGPSRLFGQIRSRLGLAYVVGSFYTAPKGGGLIGVVAQTKAGTTLATLHALENELDKFSATKPSELEMSQAKDSIVNSFVFRFDSPENIVQEQADLEFYGLPAKYLDEYPDRIREVTPEAVQNGAKKYLDRNKLRILVIGNQKKFDGPLSTLGSVTEIPLKDVD